MATHEVTNQAPPLVGWDVADDPALQAATAREGAHWVTEELHELGRLAGSAQAAEMARVVNECPPRLRAFDRYGNRVDEVEFHPYWHELLTVAVGHGLHATPWRTQRVGAHVARAAKLYVWGQCEQGHLCPVSMTYSAVPSLRHHPELAQRLEPLLASTVYEPGLVAPEEKAGLLAGMSMTEKQGGSDVRANATVATPAGGGTYHLVGHKWFTSAPMSDFFLVTAQAPGGLSCFYVPRVLPDASRNQLRLQRLKDKLGNRSNASAEVEYDGATAWLVGEEGHGIRTIMEMVNHTRLDAMTASAAGMRWGVVQAVHHATHRRAFGAALADQPLMANVLADLAVESEAACLLAMRLAGASERAGAGSDAEEAAFARLALPIAKYWVCKRAPVHAAESLECLGGNGYVEESQLPRLYREAPVNSVWEGSGSVTALDTLRALAATPGAVEAYRAEVRAAAGGDDRLDQALVRLDKELADPEMAQYRARRLVEEMALVLQAALLVRHAPAAVADAFVASRLDGDGGRAFGTLPRGIDTAAIIARARPRN